MRLYGCDQVCVCFLAIFLVAPYSHSQAARPRQDGVNAPPPQPVPYERIAPLLDALLQDGADIRFKPLVIEPEVPNGLSVDAIRSSLQIAASTNTLDAAQNQANLKLLKANSDVQITQINALQVLVSSANDAQADLSNKTKFATALKTSSATSSDQNAADQAVADAKVRLGDLQSQITTTQKAIKDSLAAPSFTSTTPGKNALGVDPTATTPLTGFNPGAPQGFTSTLPATRQIDDRIGLLYQRAMSLLSIQGVTNQLSGMRLHYLQFTPSVIYSDRKVANIDVRYSAKCGVGGTATVLDIFPRRSVVNITSEKYRDRSFSLAAFFGFTAASASAAYNRQHLELTTALAQSSYVSGYGAGASNFGWVLGRALGEDTIATGQRVFYALIAIPEACESAKALTVGVSKISFLDSHGKEIARRDPPAQSEALNLSIPPAPQLKTLSYDPAAVPTSAGAATPVYLEIGLDRQFDPQTIITVNGTALKRARDNFARATQTSTSSLSGLLESSSLDTGVWLPTSADRIEISLDATKYQDRFPRIVLHSVAGSVDILADAVLPKIAITVGNYTFTCIAPDCASQLPSLGHSVASQRSAGSALYWKDMSDQLHVAIALADDVASPTDRKALDSGLTVSTDLNDSPWGPSPTGALLYGSGKRVPLTDCRTSGIQLLCLLPDGFGSGGRILVEDTQHANGHTVQANLSLRKIQPFTPISTPPPILVDSGEKWQFSYSVFSVEPSYARYVVSLATETGGSIEASGKVTCEGGDDCAILFTIPIASLNQLTDHVKMTLTNPGSPTRVLHLSNLYRSLAPTVDSMSPDNTRIQGQNLVGGYIQLGIEGKKIPLECADQESRTDCHVRKLPEVRREEYLYFVVANNLIPAHLRGSADGSYITVSPAGSSSHQPGIRGDSSNALKLPVVKPDATKAKMTEKVSVY